MSTKTSIEWTDASWNPVRGCSLVSAGCANCYAMKQAHRFSGNDKAYWGLTEMGPQGPRWNGNITMVPGALNIPLHWRNPRRVFVNSMSDLFHEDIAEEFLDQIFRVMIKAKQHTFQILTKRPERMRDYLARFKPDGEGYVTRDGRRAMGETNGDPIFSDNRWPAPHIWLGVSIEDQVTANERIPILLQTPAAVRFISAEPLLGQVYLGGWLKWWQRGGTVRPVERGLDWAILGGESGPRARPCDLAWIRSLKDQCQATKVPVFVKQLGTLPYRTQSDGKRITLRAGAYKYERHGGGLFYEGWGPNLMITDKKGGDMAEWPADLRVRDFPQVPAGAC